MLHGMPEYKSTPQAFTQAQPEQGETAEEADDPGPLKYQAASVSASDTVAAALDVLSTSC
jgi:hypothetical protein